MRYYNKHLPGCPNENESDGFNFIKSSPTGSIRSNAWFCGHCLKFQENTVEVMDDNWMGHQKIWIAPQEHNLHQHPLAHKLNRASYNNRKDIFEET